MPGLASTTTASPGFKKTDVPFLKNSLRPFLKRISTYSNGATLPGSSIFPSQSKTSSLPHPPEEQVPLFLQPAGIPPFPFVQLSHPISFYFLVKIKNCVEACVL